VKNTVTHHIVCLFYVHLIWCFTARSLCPENCIVYSNKMLATLLLTLIAFPTNIIQQVEHLSSYSFV
jgi:hypothetical protein